MNNGLYARAGASATATAAACANRLDAPITNVSNVYFSLSRVLEVCGCAGAVNGCPAIGGGGGGSGGCCGCGPGQISWTVASASPSSSTSSLSESCAPLSVPFGGFSLLLTSSPIGFITIVCSTREPTPGRGVPGRGCGGPTGTWAGGGVTTTGGAGVVGWVLTGSTLTASETTRPSRRESASVIGSRSARSIASLAKSLGAASR